MSSDKLLEFQEGNFYDLVDKFLDLKGVRDMWEDFVYDEYQSNLPEPDIDESEV